MTRQNRNGITQPDKFSPVAVASGRERPRKGLLLPIRPDAKNTVKGIASGYARSEVASSSRKPRTPRTATTPERFTLVLQAVPDPGRGAVDHPVATVPEDGVAVLRVAVCTDRTRNQEGEGRSLESVWPWSIK